jgi:hypothetical protein
MSFVTAGSSKMLCMNNSNPITTLSHNMAECTRCDYAEQVHAEESSWDMRGCSCYAQKQYAP